MEVVSVIEGLAEIQISHFAPHKEWIELDSNFIAPFQRHTGSNSQYDQITENREQSCETEIGSTEGVASENEHDKTSNASTGSAGNYSY